MRATLFVLSFAMLATAATAESFRLKDEASGKVYGPFEFKHGSRIKIGDSQLTVVKPDAAQARIVASLKAQKIPKIDFKQANIRDVVAFLRHGVKDKDVSIVLAEGAGEADPITMLVGNSTLDNVLGILCDVAGLNWEVRHGVVMLDPK